jgi:flavin-dependent dehydrogenase
MKSLEVAVIGGGPAGAVTALRLARRGVDVGLYEPPAYERTRMAETLPPSINPLLHELRVWAGFQALGALPSYETTAVWGADEVSATSFLFSPYGNGWHVDRARFDRMLSIAAKQSGAAVFPAKVRRVRSASGGFDIDAEIPARAEVVVDATGRAARISRGFGARHIRSDRLVCAARLFPARTGELPGDTFVEAVEHGWWYAAPLPDGRRLVACFTDAPIAARTALGTADGWAAAAAATGHLRQFVTAPAAGPVRVVTAAGHRLHPCAGPGWLAVGDAALAMDPLSSGGVTSALRTASAAADALSAGDGSSYAELVDEFASAYSRQYAEVYGWETRFPRAEFWQARRTQAPLDEEALGQ